ncbi:chromate efflux transporter [Aestuariibacter salexigens]|uniref:chromate efflux transporter n=1 Tax=Aestuariibacter salexigens TaxID=226010 RepID=UPI000479CE60|nr:chromate efflux transporter [Aestuariibacter salexigens]
MQPTTSVRGRALEVLVVFFLLGLTSFGGPVAHIGYFRHALVEKRRWISEHDFTQLLALCQFLPGPASSQLGFLLGYQRAGWWGAGCAFVAFTLPSALVLAVFAYWLSSNSSFELGAVIDGLKLVACVVVFDAVLGMFRNLCPDRERQTIAIASAVIVIFADSVWAQLAAVFAGAIFGLLLCPASQRNASGITVSYGKKAGAGMLTVFLALLLTLPFFAQSHGGVVAVIDAFYRAGALVFGGGHIVLPLLEEAVVTPGWIPADTFLAGYGATQAVPGPMFTFAAFLGASIATPYSAAMTSLIAVLVIFLPGFLLVTGMIPFWQQLMAQPKAGALVAGVNAAVVGLLGATLYDPIMTSGIQRQSDLLIAIVGIAILSIWKRSPLWAVLWCVGASHVISLY